MAQGMRTRTIGNRTVSAIGLGGMPMSIEGRPDRDRSLATIHAALDAGVTLIDTADAYHLHADEVGHNESLIAEALQTWGGDAAEVLVATKGGHLRPGDGSWTIDSSPEAPARGVRGVAEAPRRGGDRALPAAPPGHLRRARTRSRSAPSASCSTRARSRWPASPTPTRSRSAWPRRSSAAGWSACRTSTRRPTAAASRSCGCATSWASRSCRGRPLGGISKAGELGSSFAPFQEVADAHGVSPQQVTLAWMLATSPVVIPIPGSSRPETARDSAAAAELELTADEMQRLDATV